MCNTYLYVDDILIFGKNLEVIIETKIFLCSNFDMKDLGVADVILGIKLIKLDNVFILTQSHYVEKLLKRFNYYEVKFVLTPYDPNQHLKKNQGESVSQHKYSQLIGSLMYLSKCTRLDISFAVGRLSRYTISLIWKTGMH